MQALESTPLFPASGSGSSPAAMSSKMLETLFIGVQGSLILFFVFGTTYSDADYQVKEYIAFRDIMAMLLLGFGYLMTFLKSYGLGAVGLTMMLTVISMQANIPIELAVRYMYGDKSDDTTYPLSIDMSTLIDSQFSAATLLITFGALIGRVSPLQMSVLTLCEAFFYAFNKVFLVLGIIGAEDVGGTMTIHMFGAYFGLAVSYALDRVPKLETCEPDKVSDILAMIGTTILWVFWPSFVGATETGIPLNEMRCVGNTVIALLASTTTAFYISFKLTKCKFDPVHIANSTLAGGVAVGSSGRLNIGPGGAAVLGCVAGAVSVYGYVYSTPYLESKFKIYDTCGVGNLHGLPSLVGGILSVLYVTLDSEAEFLAYEPSSQMFRQVLGILATLTMAIGSGYGTGKLIKNLPGSDAGKDYADEIWWHSEYFEHA